MIESSQSSGFRSIFGNHYLQYGSSQYSSLLECDLVRKIFSHWFLGSLVFDVWSMACQTISGVHTPFLWYIRWHIVCIQSSSHVSGSTVHGSLHFKSCTSCSTVGSQLSELQLSKHSIIRTLGRCHVFSSSEKKTIRSLEFCYRRKQNCCMNDFSQMLQHLFQPVWDLDHDLQHPS